MQALTDNRTAIWNHLCDLLTLAQYEKTMFKTWIEKARAAKRVSRSRRVHVLADALLAECARLAREQTWFQGLRLPRTQLVLTLIQTHVCAVQEYDHETAEETEAYLWELGRLAAGLEPLTLEVIGE